MKYVLCAVAGGAGNKDFFTYSVPKDLENELRVGHIISLPFRGKKSAGIVISEIKKPEFKTLEIKGIIGGPLPEHLVNALPWLRDRYASPISEIVKTILPTGVLKKRREIAPQKIHGQIRKRPELTKNQAKIVKDILAGKDKPHLIFGVTGSGKTEVYLDVLEKVIESGKQAVILVPEVALTPQTVLRFEERFSGKVALYHSYLKETERAGVWKDAAEGNKRIVIGSRSALFLPFDNLGLIVIDEEHETSYKQDKNPKYHAREVAKKFAETTKATLILGSATPSVESFFYAKRGDYHLHKIEERYVQEKMPETQVVDMRNEFKYGNKSILSEKLQQEIEEVLGNRRQVVLFMNRRGYSTFVSCRDCGYIVMCPRCDIPLVYHEFQNQKSKIKNQKVRDSSALVGITGKGLFCHHCDYRTNVPNICPECKSHAIKFFGKGTQKIESEIRQIFPKARVKRMDADSVKKDHKNIYEEFKNKNFDVLIGTQMIAKGWDLPNVDLVGVISADNMLNLPDFRASEHAFSLIAQVSGRTGRGDKRGKVILQTYDPENPVLKMAAKHDYEAFYESELPKREELFYPPFSRLIHLLYSHRDPKKCEEESHALSNKITREIIGKNKNIVLVGPSPAFLPKINNLYRWQILLKVNPDENLDVIGKKMVEYTKNKWKIDIDPVGTI
ncbi:primosomal protein N' [candidate division WS5 bacterium]|uniref:Replication restart protein PriA n=1 Tax=candidate division WS5 bacterium TaxID=2093353 RepID=A0A419DCM1_9BACT|nr:MAG: primosomal protein N' [candidate division WS5 bacterium]